MVFRGQIRVDESKLGPPPRLPVDPDDVNSKSIQRISFTFYMRVDTLMRYIAIEIYDTLPSTRTTVFAAKRHCLVSHKSSKCNISINNGLIAFKFDTEVKYLKRHKKIVND